MLLSRVKRANHSCSKWELRQVFFKGQGMKLRKWVFVIGLSLAGAEEVQAYIPSVVPAATCYVAGWIVGCRRFNGDRYSMEVLENGWRFRGYETDSHVSWGQVTTRYGDIYFTSGVASDGQAWVAWSRKLGWTSLTRLGSSSGRQVRLTCSRIGGCS